MWSCAAERVKWVRHSRGADPLVNLMKIIWQSILPVGGATLEAPRSTHYRELKIYSHVPRKNEVGVNSRAQTIWWRSFGKVLLFSGAALEAPKNTN